MRLYLFRRPGNIYEVAEEFRKELLRGEQQAVDEILRAYRDADRHLRMKLAAVVQRMEAGQMSGVYSYGWVHSQERYQALIHEVEHRIASLSVIAERVTRTHQAANVDLALKSVTRMVATVP